MTLANLIRPFETRVVTPPRRVETASAPTAPIVALAFGRNGSGKVMNASYSTSATVYCRAADSESDQ